jgi:glutamyl-tRNA synthetase
MGMRLRFAPSPTGALHIGGARTALYNWLLARGSGGALVLRIEDTDPERSTPENVEQILDALRWLELDWDEGPIFQSERRDRHAEVLAQLLESGHAYRSTAGSEDVRAYKERHGAERGFRAPAEAAGAIRLRVPDEGATVVHDAVRGDASFANVHLDDPVIARGDGSVLYNFAVAVDDLDAGITHVIRGEDHLSNAPKQVLVYEALGAPPPVYAHLPLLHGPDGRPLSKRHGAASVQALRDAGYLPEAVRNYIALLGAGFDPERDRFTTAELAERFSLDRVSRSPAVFDERKLRAFNGRELRDRDLDDLTARLEAFTGRTGLREAVAISHDKLQTLADFWPLCGFFFDGPADDEAAFQRVIVDGGVPALADARAALAEVQPFDQERIEAVLRALVERRAVKPKAVFQPVRVAIAGSTISPGIFESLAVLGRDESLHRIDAALMRAEGSGEPASTTRLNRMATDADA